MAFHEVQFPPAISYGATGGPGFHTAVMATASGYEHRNMDWSLARANYDVASGLKTQAELNVLLKFFYARRGKFHGFRFKDWADFQSPFPGELLPVIGTTNGTQSTFQLVKSYGDAGGSYVRPILKPVPGTVAVFSDGVPATGWTVNTTNGIVTVSAADAATTGRSITASCQFDVPVRFDIDDMKVAINDYNNFSWSSVPLVELRAGG